MRIFFDHFARMRRKCFFFFFFFVFLFKSREFGYSTRIIIDNVCSFVVLSWACSNIFCVWKSSYISSTWRRVDVLRSRGTRESFQWTFFLSLAFHVWKATQFSCSIVIILLLLSFLLLQLMSSFRCYQRILFLSCYDVMQWRSFKSIEAEITDIQSR